MFKKLSVRFTSLACVLQNLLTSKIMWLLLVGKLPVDCSDIYQNGQHQTGVYSIYPYKDPNRPVRVKCEGAVLGGGWTVMRTDVLCCIFSKHRVLIILLLTKLAHIDKKTCLAIYCTMVKQYENLFP